MILFFDSEDDYRTGCWNVSHCNNNSPIQDDVHQDDQTQPTFKNIFVLCSSFCVFLSRILMTTCITIGIVLATYRFSEERPLQYVVIAFSKNYLSRHKRPGTIENSSDETAIRHWFITWIFFSLSYRRNSHRWVRFMLSIAILGGYQEVSNEAGKPREFQGVGRGGGGMEKLHNGKKTLWVLVKLLEVNYFLF